MSNGRFFLVNVLTLMLFPIGSRGLADEIVLRSGERLTDITVVSVAAEGPVLSDGRVISLDRISSATLTQQEMLDQLLKDVGQDLFRLRIRMEKRDYENLQPHLDRLFPVFKPGSGKSALLVHLAKFQHELLEGRFELAIASHFRIYGLTAANSDYVGLLRKLGHTVDLKSGISNQILPVGIPADQIAESWESIVEAYRSLPEDHPHGLDFYFFRLAKMGAQNVAPEISSKRLQLSRLERILDDTLDDALSATDAAAIENTRLRFVEHEFSAEDTASHRALFHLVSGLLESKSEAGNRNTGLLELLRVHAEMGGRTEAVSAAALFQVVLILRANGARNDAKKVATELKSRYPSSIFAKQLKMEATN